MKKLGGIYEIYNETTGERYIGSTNDFARRSREHFKDLQMGIHYNKNLQYAYNKNYGKRRFFIFRVLEIIFDLIKLEEREQYYINKLNPEYNIELDIKQSKAKWAKKNGNT